MNGAIWVSCDRTRNGLIITIKGGAGATSRRYLSMTGLTFSQETNGDATVFIFHAGSAPEQVQQAAEDLIDHIQEKLFSSDDGQTRTPNWFSETVSDIHGFEILAPVQ